MGADNVPLRGSDAIPPSMSCHCDATQHRTLAEDEISVPMPGGPVRGPADDPCVRAASAMQTWRILGQVCVPMDAPVTMRRSAGGGARRIFGHGRGRAAGDALRDEKEELE
jgi:hypothetical protein